MERGRTDRTGWTSRRGRTDGMGGRETRMSNIEHRILNGEAEIGGVLRGGRFNRFLGCARNDNGCARNDNGCARNDKDWGWESGPFGSAQDMLWMGGEGDFKLQIANFRYPRSRAQVSDWEECKSVLIRELCDCGGLPAPLRSRLVGGVFVFG